MAEQDPYAAIAKPIENDPYASIAGGEEKSMPAFTPQQSSMIHDLGQTGIGAAKGLLHTVTALPAMAGEKLNSMMGYKQPPSVTGREAQYSPTNTAQSIGHGIEQAGEFMLPGLGEEAATGRIAGALKPAARIGYNALTTGALNKAQGGNFGTGAIGGGIGGGISEGLRAAAPKLAETAIGITKADRGFGKSPGQAILNDTRGVRPETIADSAQERLNELNPQLTSAAQAASVRPRTQPAGLLQAPQREVPLRADRLPKATRGGLFEAKEATPNEIPLNQEGEQVPGEYGYGQPLPGPQYLSGGAHPELSGRFRPSTGTLLTRSETAGARQPLDEFGRVTTPQPQTFPPISPFEPNRIASLAPARSVISSAAGKATAQNAPTTLGQLQPMARQLSQRISGEAIPEMTTPLDLLNLRRGFNDEFGHWNPETLPGVAGTGRQAYHALTDEFHQAVPGTQELDSRISNLIPVSKRAESTSRNAPLIQRTAGRFAAHTGALTGAALGATEGRREGGLPGMIVGGTAGLMAPELLATPEGRMIMARTMASPTARAVIGAPTKGALLQLDRGGKQ